MKNVKKALCTSLAIALAAGIGFAAFASGSGSLKAGADANLPTINDNANDAEVKGQNWTPTGGGACAGFCGGQSPTGCWCDNACAGFGDCCPGVCNDCPNLEHCDQGGPKECVGDLNGDGIVDAADLIYLVSNWGKCPVAGLPGSCIGFCGTNAGGCWCDEACCSFGDCCQDKTQVCGGCALPTPDCPGDLNGDGRVDMLDILILLGDWGCIVVPADPCENATGDCFSANGTPGCEDAACCGIVCAQDPYCCDVEWDSLCADAAVVLCKFDPAPECPGASCGNFIPCAADPSCICVTLFNGGGVCVLGTTACAGLTLCPAGNCAPGEICAVQTCCFDNVCIPPSTFCNVNPILPPDEPKPGTKTVGHVAYPGAGGTN